jgi:FkbM family methyltransferase
MKESLERVRLFNLVLTRSKNVDPAARITFIRSRILENCDVIVDVGSNDGQWISTVRSYGYFGKAICIEPLKENYLRLLSKNYPDIEVMNIAISRRKNHVYINKASNNGESSSVLKFNSYMSVAAPDIKQLKKYKVKSKTLSEVLPKSNKIFIKIDVQGYELEVLKSIVKKDFRRILSFEIECNLVYTYQNCALLEDIIKFLRKHKFSPIFIGEGFSVPDFGQQLQVDILFMKETYEQK